MTMALIALAATVSALVGHPVAPSAVAQASPKSFCSSPGPKDYSAALARLPQINKVPPKAKRAGVGNLPFGPGTIEMYMSTEGPVIVRPERVGYSFWDVGFLGGQPDQNPRLNWIVTAQLVALNSAGVVLREVAHGRIRIGQVDNAYQPQLDLPVPHQLVFYRFDVQIRTAEGELLGSYGEYLDVVAHSVRVRLGINARRFRAGQTVAARPEVLGTDSIAFGADYFVQQRSGGKWRWYRPMSPEVSLAWEEITGAGGAGRCNLFKIPVDTPAGQYRVVKRVDVQVSPKFGVPLTLTAPFSVVPDDKAACAAPQGRDRARGDPVQLRVRPSVSDYDTLYVAPGSAARIPLGVELLAQG